MKASEWIDRAKLLRGWESDYRAAQGLGLSRTTISKYRTSTPTLDEDSAIKVAAALGERPEAVLLDQYAERTKNPAVRSALLDAARHLCILCSIPDALKVLAQHAQRAGLSVLRAC